MRDAGGERETERVRERKREREEEEQATFQPAVTLMTPFITMCRLTSWQRHVAPDGGEGHSTIPTLRSSFVEGQQERSCGWGRKGGDRSCAGAQLDWRCTGSALQGCPCPCALTAGGLNPGPTLPYQKPKPTTLHESVETLTPTPAQFPNIPHRDVNAIMLHPRFKLTAGYKKKRKFANLKTIHSKLWGC